MLTALAALVGGIVLAQALARQAAWRQRTTRSWARSATGRQLFTLTMARTLAVALVGAAAGVLLATLLSFFVPVGEARLADPTPGFDFDALLGSVVRRPVVAVLHWASGPPSAPLGWSRRDDDPVVRSSWVVALLTASGAPPSALIGIRNALERGRGRPAVPVSSALVGAVLAVAVLCGTAEFGASLTHLTSTPARTGRRQRVVLVNSTGSGAQDLQLLDDLERPGIAAITAGVSSDVSINGHVVDGVAGRAYGARPSSRSSTAGYRRPTTRSCWARRPCARWVPASARRCVSHWPDHRRSAGRRPAASGWWGPPCSRPTSPGVWDRRGLHNRRPVGTGLSERSPNHACLSALLVDQSGALLVRSTPGPQGTAAWAQPGLSLPGELPPPPPTWSTSGRRSSSR